MQAGDKWTDKDTGKQMEVNYISPDGTVIQSIEVQN